MPLQSPNFASLALFGVGSGVLVYWLLSRLPNRPVSTCRIAATIALVLSFIPNLGLVVSSAPGTAGATVGCQMLMHINAAAITVDLLTTLARKPRPPPLASRRRSRPRHMDVHDLPPCSAPYQHIRLLVVGRARRALRPIAPA